MPEGLQGIQSNDLIHLKQVLRLGHKQMIPPEVIDRYWYHRATEDNPNGMGKEAMRSVVFMAEFEYEMMFTIQPEEVKAAEKKAEKALKKGQSVLVREVDEESGRESWNPATFRHTEKKNKLHAVVMEGQQTGWKKFKYADVKVAA